MTGPEHYREAERLLQIAMESPDVAPNADPINIAAAQVHATLALAAATVDAAFDPQGRALLQEPGWRRAAGEGSDG